MVGRNPNLVCFNPDEEGEGRTPVPCTEKIVCPGWNENVKCLSFGGNNETIECRSCDPTQEAWLGFENGERKGICMCLPKLTNIVKDNMDTTIWIVIAIYIAHYFNLFS